MLRTKYILAIFVILSAALGFLRFDSLQLGTSYDDAHYIILAESLSSGQGYQLINFPRPQIERSFPPGWPVLLTPLTFLFPGNYTILKLFSLLLWLASIFLIHKLFSKRLASPLLELLIGLVALNPLLVGSSVTVMSESAHLFFSLLALVLFDKVNEKADEKESWLLVSVALLAFYALLIRTIGISLLIALILYLITTRRFRESRTIIILFVVGFLFLAWFNARNGGSIFSAGYEAQVLGNSVSEKIGQVWSNVLGYADEVTASSLFPIFGSGLDSLLGRVGLEILPFVLNALILLLLVLGWAVWKPKLEWMHIYVIIYVLGILAFWNPRVGSVKARFLIPILPFLYFYLIQGLNWLAQKVSAKRAAMILTGLGIVLALPLLARNIQDWRNPVMNQMTDLSIGASWVAKNVPLDAIVMVNEPVPAYPHVQRKTVGYPNNGQDLEKYLNNQGIDYVIVAPLLQSPRSVELDQFVKAKILPILQADSQKFLVVYSNPEYNVTVYQYQP